MMAGLWAVYSVASMVALTAVEMVVPWEGELAASMVGLTAG